LIRWLGDRLTRVAERVVPDPLTIAVLLTGVVLVWAWIATGQSPLEVIGAWGGRVQGGTLLEREEGLSALLEFAMQMCLVLVTGHALAASPPVHRSIRALARWPRTPGGAIALTALTAMLTSLLKWGLGLIAGALTAREVGLAMRERGVAVHYPLLGAAGFTGLLIWHGGLSGSAPLRMTQAAQAEVFLGKGAQGIPLEETLGSPLNLTVCALVLIATPLLLIAMHPRVPQPLDPSRLGPPPEEPPREATGAARLDRSRILSLGLGLLVAGYLVQLLGHLGFGRLDLNALNLGFLALGLLLHPSLDS
jgi:short-chain fatty acids transporter